MRLGDGCGKCLRMHHFDRTGDMRLDLLRSSTDGVDTLYPLVQERPQRGVVGLLVLAAGLLLPVLATARAAPGLLLGLRRLLGRLGRRRLVRRLWLGLWLGLGGRFLRRLRLAVATEILAGDVNRGSARRPAQPGLRA